MATATSPGVSARLKAFVRPYVRYRHLLWLLAERDLKVRYKSSALGIHWSVLSPLLLMVVLSIVFSFFRFRASRHPFPAFLLCGLVPWIFFQTTVMSCTESLVVSGNLIKKIGFPRALIPLSTLVANLVNFALSLILLIVVLLFFRITPRWSALAVLPAAAVEAVFVAGFVLLTSSLNVLYRDVRFLTESLLTVWFYATPILYPPELAVGAIRPRGPLAVGLYQLLNLLNPLAGVVGAFRTALLDGGSPFNSSLLASALVACLTLLVGLIVFRRIEPVMADYV